MASTQYGAISGTGSSEQKRDDLMIFMDHILTGLPLWNARRFHLSIDQTQNCEASTRWLLQNLPWAILWHKEAWAPVCYPPTAGHLVQENLGPLTIVPVKQCGPQTSHSEFVW